MSANRQSALEQVRSCEKGTAAETTAKANLAEARHESRKIVRKLEKEW